jgi:tetratricopeptide (TPR) repeat protein
VRRVIIVVVLILGLSASGCGSRHDRMMLKQAREALKSGNTKVAIKNTKDVLRKSPRNIFAIRLMSKIKSRLFQDAQKDLATKKYKEAVGKLEELLELDPQNEKAKAMLADAKKHLQFAQAQEAFDDNNPIAAIGMLKEALRLDPQFQEAKDLLAEANKKAEEKIANLMITAQTLIEQKKFDELRSLAQDILAIDSQNRDAADLLREAQAQILSIDKEKNLEMAKKFYQEGIYESALLKAEAVLKVDPTSHEAKELIQRSKAELAKPQLRLTGLSKIKGMLIAHIEVPSTREKFVVREGETFFGEGDFKVSAIDIDLKTVVVTYLKTGSQQSITTTFE